MSRTNVPQTEEVSGPHWRTDPTGSNGEVVPDAFGRGNPLPEAFGRGDAKKPSERHNSRTDDSPKPDAKSKSESQTKNANDPDKPEKPPFYKRLVLMSVIVVAVLAVGTGGLLYYLHSRHFEKTDDAYIDGHIIPISPKVQAIVRSVLVDDNKPVKRGDLLVELDERDFQVIFDQMKANQSAAEGKVAQVRTNLEAAKANVGEAQAEAVVAEANATNARQDFERINSLNPQARSKQQLDAADAMYRSTGAQVQQAKAKVTAAQAQLEAAQKAVTTAEADLKRAGADVHQAEINLSYCRITAPEDGIIARKNVEPGALVSVGQPLFSIVQTDVWVTANYKETQLDDMHPGQPVTIRVDAFPGHDFTGKVDSIQPGSGSRFSLMPPENATGNFVKVVQRVPVKILFDAGQLDPSKYEMAPGMSVEPSVRVR